MENNVKGKDSGRGINWFALLVAAIFIYAGWILAEQQMTLGELGNDMVAAQERLQSAKAENQQLKDENAMLYDEAYIEKLAREELAMTRKDEMPYIYADNK